MIKIVLIVIPILLQSSNKHFTVKSSYNKIDFIFNFNKDYSRVKLQDAG